MDIRNSFSRLKKKVKHLGSKQKLGRTGVNVDGESVDPDDLLPQPDHHVAAGDGEWSGADEDGRQASSMDQPPQLDEPEALLANRGEHDQLGGGEAEIDGRKIRPMYSRSHSDIGVGAGSGPYRDGNGTGGEDDGEFYSCSSTPSISHGGEPDGA